jgi:LAO/AO transport system kinase
MSKMEALVNNLLAGDVRALARVISLVEDHAPGSDEILDQLSSHGGQARIIGVTGSPGVGKSSLVDRLAAHYRRQGAKPGIIAVDPSSAFTGGAILGDRIRMNALTSDPGIFIRSMATRGYLGGLAATTADVATVLDAASRDPVLIETVGVGQDEIDIAKLADVTIVVLVPGMGDDVQALKAGIMEIGDIFVINKCDRSGVEKMERSLLALLSLVERPEGPPPIVKTVATDGTGIEELAAQIDAWYTKRSDSAAMWEKKKQVARQRLLTFLRERAFKSALDSIPSEVLENTIDRIARREIGVRHLFPQFPKLGKEVSDTNFRKLPQSGT